MNKLAYKYNKWFNHHIDKIRYEYLMSFERYLESKYTYDYLDLEGVEVGHNGEYFKIDGIFSLFCRDIMNHTTNIKLLDRVTILESSGIDVPVEDEIFIALRQHLIEAYVKSVYYTPKKINITKSEQPTEVYLHIVKSREKEALKYGYSLNAEKRVSEQIKNTNFSSQVLKVLKCKTKKEAREVEQTIQEMVGGFYLSKEDFPDGYTETVPVQYKDLLEGFFDYKISPREFLV